MAIIHGFDTSAAAQGAVFSLNTPATRSRVRQSGSWEAEIRKGVAHVCVRGDGVSSTKAIDAIAMIAHSIAEELLDVAAVDDRTPLLLIEPEDNVAWRTGPHGTKVQLTQSIVFAAEPAEMQLVVGDANGHAAQPTPRTPTQHHPAFRYFRYSQATPNLFDAYRNMFLALESVLDHIAPKIIGERETDWLRRALAGCIDTDAIDLSPFTTAAGQAPVEGFIDSHYAAVRCALFHAKVTTARALQPGSLRDHTIVTQQLLAVQRIVEQLLKSRFSVRLPQSGFFDAGFRMILGGMAPVIHLFFSPEQCPTLEEVLEQGDCLPVGGIGPVRLADRSDDHTDECLFVTELKPPEFDFDRISTLRLVAHLGNSTLGAMALFAIPFAEKLNRTLLTSDLVLAGCNKLIVRTRCVLRNVQSPRRGFAT